MKFRNGLIAGIILFCGVQICFVYFAITHSPELVDSYLTEER